MKSIFFLILFSFYLIAAPIKFAVIGDFGLAGKNVENVSKLIKSWKPDFIVTVGDNNYFEGAASTIDKNIGQYFSDFIYPYKGKYGKGATKNNFWPVLGNHDWYTNPKPYYDYFTTLNRKSYYSFSVEGNNFYMLNSNKTEPDGTTEDSNQADWLKKKMKKNKQGFNFVVFHHPPYTSEAEHDSTKRMRWPFKDWGADVILSGHQHFYERLEVDGLTYFVNGIGGCSLYGIKKKNKHTVKVYEKNYGAQLVEIENNKAVISLYNIKNELIDKIELKK
jgi:predicted phosphodiesterase